MVPNQKKHTLPVEGSVDSKKLKLMVLNCCFVLFTETVTEPFVLLNGPVAECLRRIPQSVKRIRIGLDEKEPLRLPLSVCFHVSFVIVSCSNSFHVSCDCCFNLSLLALTVIYFTHCNFPAGLFILFAVFSADSKGAFSNSFQGLLHHYKLIQ